MLPFAQYFTDATIHLPSNIGLVLQGILGGLFLSVSTSLLLNDYGRILGCSGIMHSFISYHIQGTRAGEVSGRDKADIIETGLGAGIFIGGIVLFLLKEQLRNLIGRSIFDYNYMIATKNINIQLPDRLTFGLSIDQPISLFFTAGVLTGLGTKLAKGCTSGHMLCGISRLNARSLLSTTIFFSVAVYTTKLTRSSASLETAFHVAEKTAADRNMRSTANMLADQHSESLSNLTIPALILLSPLILYILSRSDNFTAFNTPAAAIELISNINDESPTPSGLGESEKTYNHELMTVKTNGSRKVVDFIRSVCLGMTFAYGLGLSTMTRMSVLLGFFNIPLSSGDFEARMQLWDPTLLGVVIGGLVPNFIFYRSFLKRKIRIWVDYIQNYDYNPNIPRNSPENPSNLSAVAAYAPRLSNNFEGWTRLPELSTLRSLRKSIQQQSSIFSLRLVVGSILFGIGWGLVGLCPGPAMVSFSASATSAFIHLSRRTGSSLFRGYSMTALLPLSEKVEEFIGLTSRFLALDNGTSEFEALTNFKLISVWFGGYVAGSLLGSEL